MAKARKQIRIIFDEDSQETLFAWGRWAYRAIRLQDPYHAGSAILELDPEVGAIYRPESKNWDNERVPENSLIYRDRFFAALDDLLFMIDDAADMVRSGELDHIVINGYLPKLWRIDTVKDSRPDGRVRTLSTTIKLRDLEMLRETLAMTGQTASAWLTEQIRATHVAQGAMK